MDKIEQTNRDSLKADNMEQYDHNLLRASFEIARKARAKGNHPFGALLVDEQGQVLLEAENTVVTTSDCTGHAEINLIRKASERYDRQFLATCTVYTSTEPCPMCAGAIFWSNVRRVVFGLSEQRLYEMIGSESDEVLLLPCHEVFAKGRKPIEVIGPMLEEEALQVHLDFWK
jgi:tRNA(Arg) A34 adenosine deaminase TadA